MCMCGFFFLRACVLGKACVLNYIGVQVCTCLTVCEGVDNMWLGTVFFLFASMFAAMCDYLLCCACICKMHT